METISLTFAAPSFETFGLTRERFGEKMKDMEKHPRKYIYNNAVTKKLQYIDKIIRGVFEKYKKASGKRKHALLREYLILRGRQVVDKLRKIDMMLSLEISIFEFVGHQFPGEEITHVHTHANRTLAII